MDPRTRIEFRSIDIQLFIFSNEAYVQSGNNDTDFCLQIHKSELHLLKLRQKLNIDCNWFITFTSAGKTRATVE